jgi:hypothetical protein
MADIKELKPARAARTDGRSTTGGRGQAIRDWLAQGFTRVEDVVYIGLGLMLAGSALALLADGLLAFGQAVLAGELASRVVTLLDRILLILMIVEILYTVQVSFREHTLIPEPFLIVGLIAAVRRILLLTAEFPKLLEQGESAFRHAMWELGLLTVMVPVLVISVVLLRRRSDKAVAEKA